MFSSSAKSEENYPVGQAVQPEPELININGRLNKLNAEYLDILYSLEDRLHNILNLRSPDKTPPNETQPKSINDFVGSINEQMSVYQMQNNRLLKALDHLRRIIA